MAKLHPDTRPALDDERFEHIMTAVYGVEPSDALRRRIAQIGANAPEPGRPRFKFKLALAGAAALGAVGVAVMWPQLVGARELRLIRSALETVVSEHDVTMAAAPGATMYKQQERWLWHSILRVENADSGSVQIMKGHRMWSYTRADNVVRVMHLSKGITSTFDFTMAGIAKSASDPLAVRALRDITIANHTVRVLSIGDDNAAGPGEERFYVDPVTDLPIRSELRQQIDGDWRLLAVTNYDFNRPVDASQFVPLFPKSARVMDVNREAAEFKRHLAEGIARKRFTSRTVVLRDLQVNADGDVFLLYTAGKKDGDRFNSGQYMAGRDWLVDVTDNLGTKYKWVEGGLFQGDIYSYSPKRPDPWIFGGDKLEGDWWVPAKPIGTSRPHRLIFRFRVSPVNIHGHLSYKQIPVTYSETTSFGVAAPQPSCHLRPQYTTDFFQDFDDNAVELKQAEIHGQLPPGVMPSREMARSIAVGDDSILDLSFTADGNRLAASVWGSQPELIDQQSGKEQPIGTRSANVYLSASGRIAAEVNSNDTGTKSNLVLVSTADSKVLRTLVSLDRNSWVVAAAFSPDETTVTAAISSVLKATRETKDRTVLEARPVIMQWDVAAGRLLARRSLPAQQWAGSMTFAGPAGLVVADNTNLNSRIVDSKVHTWSLASWSSLERTLVPPGGIDIGNLCASGNGAVIAVLGGILDPKTVLRGYRIAVWDAKSGRTLHILQPSVNADRIALSNDGRWLATAGQDNAIYLWDLSTGTLAKKLIGHARQPVQLAFAPDGRTLASGDIGGTVILWHF